MGSLERVICFPKIGDRRLAKIGAGGKPLVGDSLRTFGPHEKNLLPGINSNKTLRTHWDGNQLRFMRFPPVGIKDLMRYGRFKPVNPHVQSFDRLYMLYF